jgi:hypothetical protein
MVSLRISVVAASVLLLVACGKVSEKASEKVIESQLSKDGTQAKVDLSGGGFKMTSTDASGKTTQLDMGAAKVSEADLGLAFYPGTQPREGGSTRISTPEGTTYTVTLHSDDAPDKVATFYRDKLKAQAEGKQFVESGGDGSHMLMLADDKTKQVTQVMVGKADPKGSDIQILANRGAAK